MDADLIKQRDIHFHPGHRGDQPAQRAAVELRRLAGIDHLDVIAPDILRVQYRLPKLTLAAIETCLRGIGFQLDNSLLSKIKRALFHYTEETQMANLGFEHDQAHNTRDVFINSYLHREHGNRDHRPDHLRQYF